MILRKVSTTSNTADLGTKPLSTKHLLDILAKLGYRLLDEMPLKTAFSCLIIGAKGEDVNLTAEEHNDGKFEAVFLFVMSMLVFIGLLCCIRLALSTRVRFSLDFTVGTFIEKAEKHDKETQKPAVQIAFVLAGSDGALAEIAEHAGAILDDPIGVPSTGAQQGTTTSTAGAATTKAATTTRARRGAGLTSNGRETNKVITTNTASSSKALGQQPGSSTDNLTTTANQRPTASTQDEPFEAHELFEAHFGTGDSVGDVVFVCSGGKKFHSFRGCKVFRTTREKTADTRQSALAHGYSECSRCFS